MNKILVSFIFSVVAVIPALGMTVEELFVKMKQSTQSAQYGYEAKYSLFKSYNSEQVHSSYDGYLYQQGDELYQKIKNTEFVYAKELSIKINHEQKRIQIDPPTLPNALNFNPQEAFKLCAAKGITESSDAYVVTLEFSASSISPFAKVVMRVSKKNYFLKQLDLYYKTEQDFAPFGERPDRSKPKLRITMSNLDREKEQPKLVDISSYVRLEKNKVSPAQRYSGYKIIDNRIN